MKQKANWQKYPGLIGIAVFAALIISFTLSSAAYADDARGKAGVSERAKTGVLQPAKTPAVDYLSRPTSAQIDLAKAGMAAVSRANAVRPRPGVSPAALSDGAAAAPPPGSETQVIGENAPNAPSTFTIFRSDIPTETFYSGYQSDIAEAAVSAAGKDVFMTWNWGAASSADGGQNWTYVNPWAGPWPAGVSFCCDQDTLYDRGRDMHIWYRMGLEPNYGENAVIISRSIDDTSSWVDYVLVPTDLGLTGEWFDYPQIATTNDFLYITTNMFQGLSFARTAVIKINLNVLRAGGGLTYQYWDFTYYFTLALAQGATDTMFMATTYNAASGWVDLLFQKEGQIVWNFSYPTVPAWTPTNRGDANCPVPNGSNPCGRFDDRMMAGYIARNDGRAQEVAFFWNVAEGGSYAAPYIDGVKFRAGNRAIYPGNKGRPLVWSGSTSFFTPAFSPNERGHVAGVINYVTPGYYVRAGAVIDDDYNGTPPGWSLYYLAGSSGGPSNDVYGDYNRVRPYYPGGAAWIGSFHTTTSSANNSNPQIAIFGRARDRNSVENWWDK
ncbi:MAG: hypothetical protein IEMM0002_0063 [bacterium]|nr:MAG: hypothetical protein IEMM0002_0063 [bacterium]